MVNARAVGRIGILAVGLGFGAAVACAGTASADSGAADPFNWLGGFDPLSAAATTSPVDLDISVDGFQVLDLGSTAVATSGTGDIAIAFGANSTATAEGGFGDYAAATTGATAIAGNTDIIGGHAGDDFDVASAEGVGSYALAGNDPAHGGFSETIGSSFDYASASSGNNIDPADGAHAFAGTNGSFDSASAVGQHVLADSGLGLEAPANFDGAATLGNLTAPTTELTAAIAGYGSSDNAFVLDPLGAVGSSAYAEGTFGLINNMDLAGVFGDMLHANATAGSNMVDILPTLFG